MPEPTESGPDAYLQDGHKLWWHLDRLSAWRRGELIAPIYLEVSPTTVCNHRCLFCALDFAQDRPLYLDTGAFIRSAPELAASGVKSVLFAGEGEPLLHQGLPDMIRSAAQAGLDAALNTNASLGEAQLWRELLPHLVWVRLSLDAGSDAIYSLVHGAPRGALSQTLGKVETALKTRRDLGLATTIGAQYVLVEANALDLENALKLCAELGLDYISVKPFSRHPLMRQEVAAAVDTQTVERLEGLCREYDGRGGVKVIFRRRAFDAELSGELAFSRCRAMPFLGYVSSDGGMHTCNVLLNDPRYRVGQLGRDSVGELIWGRGRRRALEQSQALELSPACRRNCRLARINEFLEQLSHEPQHVNFI